MLFKVRERHRYHFINNIDFLMNHQKLHLRSLLLLGAIFLINYKVNAQYLKPSNNSSGQSSLSEAIKSKVHSTECVGNSTTNLNKPAFLTHVRNYSKKTSFDSSVLLLKAQKTIKKSNIVYTHKEELNTQDAFANLSIANNFQGNIFNGGAPPDNTIAVAENGNIVSVINCNIAYYNRFGRLLWTGSFWELFNDPALTEIIYDPIVLYDATQDRFIMIAIHGFNSTTSKLIVCFSKSNNPMDGWWIYKLSGNPLNNSCWTDYPKLGISNNEVFITGNLFNEMTGFSQSIVYQITKANGFSGTNLNWIVWTDINSNPSTLIPVSYGQKGNYGPGLYFVSQSPGRGNAVDLYEITSEIANNPKLTRKRIFKPDYEPAGNAEQAGSPVQLVTGDCRILNAFYLDGIIHYVFQDDYQNSGYTGINYNRLNVNTLTNQSFSYGEPGFDCAFPSVASYATTASDKTVIFCFLRSSSAIFPETRAVVFNGNQTWSSSILVKAGNNYVDAFQFENTARWGDYTGIAYKNNSTGPEVWISGCYGSTQRLFNTQYNCFNTWIAQLNNSFTNTDKSAMEKPTAFLVFPNPVVSLYNVEFNFSGTNPVKIDILDINGKVIHTLFRGNLKSGKTLLTFNRKALSSGLYIIRVSKPGKVLFSQKLYVD